jgi:predicted secreted protein
MSTREFQPESLPARLDQLQRNALLAGAVGLAIWGVAALVDGAHRQVHLGAYLTAYLYWLGIALGCLAIVLLHELTGGLWGFLIRRPLEAAVMTLPLMAVLFLPVVLGMKVLYPWTDLRIVEASAELRHKSAYLNVDFFLIRAAIYFIVWIVMAFVLNWGERAQDRTEDPAPTRRLQGFSGPALVIHFLAVTFAMIDWGMSLEPLYFSTIYGPMLMIGFGLNGFAVMILVSARLVNVRPMADLATPVAFNDLGNLLLAFVMLWAYMAFSQFLITWSGNLTEEIPFYLHRSRGLWWWVAAFLIVFHFFLPFFVLLGRENKRQSSVLAIVAAWIATVHIVDLVWLIFPAFGPWNILAFWSFVPAMIGIGGLSVAVFTWQLKGMPLVPLHDPVLTESIEHQAVHPVSEN